MRRSAMLLIVLMLVFGATPGWADLPDPERALSDPAMESIAGYQLCQEFERLYIHDKSSILPSSDPEARYVRKITDRLIGVVNVDRPDLAFEVKVVKNREINALCIPGGHIYVFTGLLDAIRERFPAEKRDDVFAAVIGHEMAHATLRHTLQTMARSKEYELVLKDREVFQRLVMTTSRAMELEADRYGALYMMRAGFKLSAALELFEKLPSTNTLEGTHPTGGQRIRQMRTYMAQMRGLVDLWDEALRAANSQNYSQARVCFAALRAQFPNLPSVHNNLGWTLYGLYQQSVPQGARPPHQVTYNFIADLGVTVRGLATEGDTALLQAAQKEFAEALRYNPSLLPAYEGAAACALDAGDTRVALAMLAKAKGKDARLANLWGIAYERQGRHKDAIASYNQAIKLDSRYLPALYNLGCAYDRQGRKSQAVDLLNRYVSIDRQGYWSEKARQLLERLGAKPAPVAARSSRVSSAGGVQIGQTVVEVVKHLGRPDGKEALASGTEIYHYRVGIDVYFSEAGVSGVTIRSTAAGPVEGLSVGMPAPKIEAVMGPPQSASKSDNGEVCWNYPSLGIIVGIRNGRAVNISIQR